MRIEYRSHRETLGQDENELFTDSIRLLEKEYRRGEGMNPPPPSLFTLVPVYHGESFKFGTKNWLLFPANEIKVFCEITFKQFNINTGTAHIS
jgi:hypothetical protein